MLPIDAIEIPKISEEAKEQLNKKENQRLDLQGCRTHQRLQY